MSSKFDSVFVNNKSLRPAPYITTSYEYNRSGEYIIGGLLILTLSGTIIGENIASEIAELSELQTITNCVSVKVGCAGSTDFLDGSGRIRSVTINPSDQPYLASYSIQLALEYLDGKPAVQPDDEFLRQNCLSSTSSNIAFLQNYSESLSVSGQGDVITSVDNTLRVSKSYIKASGKISVTSFAREICGVPDYNGTNNSLSIIKERANSLLSMNSCVSNSPLSQFSSWNKWIDTQSLTIDTNGTVVWSFDMYMSKGNAQPQAWIDITTERTEYRAAFIGSGLSAKAPTTKISGTIKGLSASTSGFLETNSDSDRMTNAETAYNFLNNSIINGLWSTDVATITGGGSCTLDPCEVQEEQTCRQRISSNVRKSMVSGEISFSAEYGPINACKPVGVSSIELTVEDQMQAARYVEHIIPNGGSASVIQIGDTPRKVTITARGTLQGCDTNNMSIVRGCVIQTIGAERGRYAGSWLLIDQKITDGLYAYSISETYLECQG